MIRSLAVLIAIATVAPAADPGPWATYRGNPQRTGNTDGKPGPDKPAVLWAVPSQDHFIAAPVPVGESLFTSAFGAFNKPAVSLLPMADGKKPTWTRSTPTLKLASVSSPAVTDKFVLFGDGLHQDSGGVLHCLAADTGRPVWQLPLPGDLIHLEGGPTVADGKAYTGAGSAGVLCVAIDQLTLDGKDVTAAEVAKLQETRWKELQAKFEAAKKKDPDFAVPPSEDQLHKPEPKRVWQEGAKKWHVDAPVNVVGELVIVCSGFLEKEKAGERVVAALDAKTGKEVWKATDDPPSYSSPTLADIDGTPHAVVFTRTGIVAVGVNTGKVKYTRKHRAKIVASVNAAVPLVSGTEIFATASYDTGAALWSMGKTELEEVWANDSSLSCQYDTPVKVGDHLFGIHGRQDQGSASLVCVEWKTGAVKWTQKKFGVAHLIAVDGGILALTEDGELVRFAADTKEYKEQGRAKVLDGLTRAAPALSDGRLYLRNDDKLVCVNLK